MARSVGSVSVSVVPDATGFVEKLRAELEAGTGSIGDHIGRNIGSAMSDALNPYLEQIRIKLDELGAREVKVRVKVDDNGGIARTEAELAAVDSAAGAGGNGFNIFGSKIANIGIAAIAAADIAIPAILAIGAAAAGALAGVAVLGLGFSGIGAALQAHGQKSGGGGGGGGGASSALSQQSAQINASQATKTAQDQLTAATQTQTKAEKDLHDARVQALQDLEDLDNKLKDNTLSQVQAAINLKIAQQTLAVTLNAPGANQAQYANQVAQARLNVATAQQKVNELTLEGTRLTTADATAHKNGVNNNPGVLSAQQALINANHKLAEAQANIGIVAQKNAIALQQAAISMAGAAGGANAFGDAMSKLNPIQQQFVEFLLKMKPLLDQIKLAASGFLPGLEQGIKNAAPAFAPIIQIVGNIAKAMGSVFANIGAQFATPQGQKFLNFLSTELPNQIIFLGNLFIDFGKILSGIFEAAGPLIDAFDSAFLGALDSLGQSANGGGLKAFFASLLPEIKPTFEALGALGGTIGTILAALVPVLVPVLKLITSLATEVGKLAQPVIKPLAKAVGDLATAFAPLLPEIGRLVGALLPPLIGLLDNLINGGFAPLIQVLLPVVRLVTQVLTDIPQLAPILVSVALAVKAWAIAQGILNAVLEANPFVLLATALGVLVIGLIEAYKHSDTFRAIVKEAFKVVGDIIAVNIEVFKALGTIAVGVFTAISGAVSSAYNNVIKPIFGFIKTLAIDPLVTAMHGLGTVWHDVWNGMKTVISDVWKVIKPIVDAMLTVYHAIKDIVTFISDNTVLTPDQGKGIASSTGQGGQTHAGTPHRASGGPVLAGLAYRVEEFGPEMFIPKVDGTIVNALNTQQYANGAHGTKQYNTFNNYGQADPAATAHQTANRFAARGV